MGVATPECWMGAERSTSRQMPGRAKQGGESLRLGESLFLLGIWREGCRTQGAAAMGSSVYLAADSP
jgi:hypothetical protein